MGLLVAGITGGASLIDTARITSAKRELDDYVRDTFTFYSRVGRLPGDLQNSGIIGHTSGNTYSNTSFSSPYNISNIKEESAPFIELYLYDISSFRPDPSNVITNPFCDNTNTRIPLSKIYKNKSIAIMYRGSSDISSDPLYFRYGIGGTSIELCSSNVDTTIQMRDIARKIDIKFDDGNFQNGNIRSYCISSSGNYGFANYDIAIKCSDIVFYFNSIE
jgi:hypothetical protein